MLQKMNGKTVAIGAILKTQGPFKVAHITEMSGLSRQLSYHHVTKLTEEGMLIRHGQTYTIRDRDELVDCLVNAETTPGLRLMEPAGLFTEKSTEPLNDLVKGLVYAKLLELPDAIDMTVHMNRMLDDSLAEIRALKRYLNNAQPMKKKAVEFFIFNSKLRNLHIWDRMVEWYDFTPSVEKKIWEFEIGEREE